MKGVGSLLMGAKTYEQVLSFDVGWPYKGKKTFVLTHRELELHPDGDIEFTNDAAAALSAAKEAAGENSVWLVGGANVVSEYLNRGKIDEMMIFVIPALLQEGIPLFTDISSTSSLRLLNSVSYENGIVQLNYSCT